MTIEQVWQYGKERGSEFYSPYISDVDYLDSNQTDKFNCFSIKFEITPSLK